MWLSQEQMAIYRERGVVTLDSVFDSEEIETLRQAFRRDAEIPGEHRIIERDSAEVRSVYASHLRQPEFASLIRSPRLLGPARQLVGEDVYLYQLKVNSKSAFTGGGWSWHQDYAAWKVADNLMAPRLLNVVLLLDEVTEFNGPIVFVPGSHRHGLVRDGRRAGASLTEQHLDPDDIALAPEDIRSLVDRYGLESATGRAGSVVLFHPEIVHGSATNMSPYQRRLLIITYNDVRNRPRPLGPPRAEYLVGRDAHALEFIDEQLVATDGGVGR